MNLSQYIIAALIVQTVNCNTIGRRMPPRFRQKSRTEFGVESNDVGFKTNGDNRDFASKEKALITYDLKEYSSNGAMTPSNIHHLFVTSQSSSMTSHSRVRRADSEKEKRPECDKACRKARRKLRNKGKKGKKKRKGKKNKDKKGRKRNKSGKDRKGRKPGDRKKKPPITSLILPTNTTIPGKSGPKQTCVRSAECPEGHCCARHHFDKICKPYLKLDDICSRPTRKHRKRNLEHFELCPCEGSLACQVPTPLKTKSKSGTKGRAPKLYTCRPST